MIAIGIDPGTRNLGWGVVEANGNRLVHLGHGVVRVRGEETLSRRLLHIADELGLILQHYCPEVGSVEGIFFDKNAQSAAKLGHARGVVLLCLERAQVPIREHSPARIKRTVAGSGAAEKSQVNKMVCAILRLDSAPPLDASDALAVAITELRVDPRATAFSELARKAKARRMPAHFAAALERSKKLR